jgi:DNA-binding transcriptional MerR regulator
MMHMNAQNRKLTIREAARELGLSEHTLRYYERIGLIHSIGRAGNTHRRYSPEDIGWIGFLAKMRSTGMPIRTLQRYVELTRQGDEPLPERLAILEAHREKVRADIDELRRNMDAIDFKISFYRGELEKKGRL